MIKFIFYFSEKRCILGTANSFSLFDEERGTKKKKEGKLKGT
jgi:hypothetical protein